MTSFSINRIRIRQCYVQLDSCPDNIARIPVFLNIIKYFTSFPPIWLTAAASLGYTHPQMPYYVSLAAFINTTYSFLVSSLCLFLCCRICNVVCCL